MQDVRKLLSEKRQLETTLGGSQAEVEELVADMVAQRESQNELEMAVSALGTNCEELEAQLKDAAARENAVCTSPPDPHAHFGPASADL